MRAVLAAIVLAMLTAAQEPAVRKGERFAGIMTAGPLNPAPIAIEIGVDRWSDDQTRAGLFDIYHAGGQPALAEALKKAGIAGYVRMPNHERLHAAYVQEESRPDGGR